MAGISARCIFDDDHGREQDEQQGVKNADAASAWAARLLQGDHKLAKSGTPVENRQMKPVFACPLTAKGTVVERILELQRAKRDLADAIIGEDNSVIRNMSREDLEMLLG